MLENGIIQHYYLAHLLYSAAASHTMQHMKMHTSTQASSVPSSRDVTLTEPQSDAYECDDQHKSAPMHSSIAMPCRARTILKQPTERCDE